MRNSRAKRTSRSVRRSSDAIANRLGSTASRSTSADGVSAQRTRPNGRPKRGCSGATHSRSRYSALKTVTETHSIARSHCSATACTSRTESATTAATLITIRPASAARNAAAARVGGEASSRRCTAARAVIAGL